MALLARLFPIMVFLATLALMVFAFRLDKKLSRGSRSPGPREIIQANPAGQQQTPWELKAINDQINWGQNSMARRDLTTTVNRLTKAAGVTEPSYMLPSGASDEHIAAVIGYLESKLELTMLTPSGNGEHTEHLSFGTTLTNPAAEQLGPPQT